MRTLNENEVDAVSGGASVGEGVAVAVGGAIVVAAVCALPIVGLGVAIGATSGFLAGAIGYGLGWANAG
jgi:hypothetical protein